jgi:hypothetical protein
MTAPELPVWLSTTCPTAFVVCLADAVDAGSVVKTCGVTFVIVAACIELKDASIERMLESVVVAAVGPESSLVICSRNHAIREDKASDFWGPIRINQTVDCEEF